MLPGTLVLSEIVLLPGSGNTRVQIEPPLVSSRVRDSRDLEMLQQRNDGRGIAPAG